MINMGGKLSGILFDNLLKQEFSASTISQKWCTDFTCLFLTDGSKRYNCSILDLHDRSIVASITDKNITADLALLNRCLNEYPKGIIIGKDVDVGHYKFGEHEFVDYSIECVL